MSLVIDNLEDAAFLKTYPDLYNIYKLIGERNAQLQKEALEKNKEEAHVRELLLSEPTLSIWMQVSPNNESTVLSINDQWWQVHKWDPTNERTTVKKMLEAYEKIQWFRKVCVQYIRYAIEKAMLPLWNETDEKILERDAIQKSGGCGWSGPHAYIKNPVQTTHTIDKYWWKVNIQDEVGRSIYGVTLNNGQDLIVDEIGLPLYNEELTKWLFFCRKIVERSRAKPRLIEEAIESLNKRNEILEEKIKSIRSIIDF